MNGLTFNGVHSDSFGLIMKTVQRSAGAPVRQKEIVIPGRDGAFVFPYKKRDNKTHSVRFTYTAKSLTELRQKEREIGAWLSEQEAYLIFDDEPDIAYLATAYNEIVPTEDSYTKTVDIEFVCQPYGFSVKEAKIENHITSAYQDVIEYQGTQEVEFGSQQGSFFVVEIEGSFTKIKVSINDVDVGFNDAISNEKIVVDVANGTITKDGENIIDEAIFTSFFILHPGENSFEVTGSDLDCDVRVIYKALYI